MAEARSATATQVRLEQDHAEQTVLAQSSLIGERAVSWTRFGLMALIGMSTGGVAWLTGEPIGQHWLRPVVIGVYLAFAISSVVATSRVKVANPKVAYWAPFLFIVVDAAFFAAHAALDASLGVPARPEIIVASYAVLVCFSVARLKVLHVVFSTVVSILAVVGLAILQRWAHPVWTSFVCGCLLALGYLVSLTNRRIRSMFIDIRRRENLSRFLPRQVVERVLNNTVALAPVQREVTILFSDIRGFTSMSETMPPREVLEFLDEYFGHMAQIVKGHDGMLNKFLGDGMLAVWGVPDFLEDHAARAMRAAFDMRRKMQELNAERQQRGLPVFRIGIGLHTGVVAAGMLGGVDQREYTVIGDAVNLASRIEGLTKTFNTDILASERAWEQGKGRFTGERVGEEHVKGRDAAVVIYALREAA